MLTVSQLSKSFAGETLFDDVSLQVPAKAPGLYRFYLQLITDFWGRILVRQNKSAMAKYLISFPSAAMVVPDGEWEAVGRDAHAVIDEAKAAGVYVFGGGIDEAVPPVLVSADGTFSAGGYSWAPPLNGGFTVLELPSREEAIAWAARIAKACRCHQELRVFGFDPAS